MMEAEEGEALQSAAAHGQLAGCASLNAENMDLLALLPGPLVLSNVLPRLEAADLIHLAACCRWLRTAAFADDVWRPRCKERSWGPFPRGVTWQEGFTSLRKSLCVECGAPSRYVFALLQCRLCERCEHESPRYGLVTALEAAERYGVSYAAMAGVPSHGACRTRFYLRTVVESLAASGSGSRGGLAASPAGAGSGDEEEESEDGDGGEGQEQEQEAGEEHNESDEGDAEGDGGGGGAEGPAAARRAADKAARKAAKKAAKEAQRAKREGRNTPGGTTARPSYGRIAMGSSPPTGSPGTGHARRGGRGSRGDALLLAAGRSPPGCRAAGPLLVAQDEGDGQALPLEGQAVPKTGRSRARGGGGSGGRAGGGGGGGGRAVKLKSGWAAEREALMGAWGQFGISGLVLAS